MNEPLKCRVLIDSCSSRNFITTELAKRLGLPQQDCYIPIGALNALSTASYHKMNVTIQSRINSFKKNLHFFTIPVISAAVPSQQIDRSLLKIPQALHLADPEFHKSSPIDMIIGTGPTFAIQSIGKIKLPDVADVYAQKTLLGWVIAGNMDDETDTVGAVCHFQFLEEFKRFWEIEDGITQNDNWSEEEHACEEHFIKHVTRTLEGRYIVTLPFNERREQLGSSRTQAKRRLLALERRFKWHPILRGEYTKVIEDYKRLGYMTKIEDEVEEGFYLPHHAVLKESSLTTKLRVVFDGSAQSNTKVSLNNALMVGPTIQDTIFTLVLRFRLHNYVITGDIEKMYVQILVREEDRKYQRILWKEDNQINTYELQRVTFGLASAPYLAIRTLYQLADDEKERFPIASTSLKKDLYVDDWLAGAQTKEAAIELRDEMIGLLKAGQFNLRQCASNSPELLQGLPECAVNRQLLGGDDPTLKTLGIHWDSQQDAIVYTVNPIATRDTITMRTIASDVARIFDPLGLLNPVIAHAKIMQQQLWRLKLEWDESVPTEIYTAWKQFAAELPFLNQIQFNRKIAQETYHTIELHGFADASEKAYGACIYIRTTNTQGTSETNLYCAKSRITPLKGNHSIPRLELCAAELLAEMYSVMKNSINLKFDREFFWTDSTVTLYWINTAPHLLQRFVANRVAKIQGKTNPQQWRHVRTHDNPADAISRGQLPTEFLKNTLWKHGPMWFNEDEDNWPHFKLQLPNEILESKQKLCLHLVPEDNSLFSRFSSFNRLLTFVRYCFRWKNRISRTKKNEEEEPESSLKEVQEARDHIIKLVQQGNFKEELQQLKQDHPIPKKSALRSLTPFIDQTGLIRVGGRLSKSTELSYVQKHPLVLPKSHPVTHLIIKQIHEDNLHAGIQTPLHLIRKQYWPIDGKNQVKYIIRKCLPCARANPTPTKYIMSDLPKERITQSKPFEHTGVDFCGPFFIKEKRLRNRNKVKVWVAIFVCFSTKAVHIELVDDLSTAEFLAAFSRFIARHPSSKCLRSDNGTNFTGANRELKEIYEILNSEESGRKIQQDLTKKGIQWKFIPAQSPHCGGIWEAAVKSFKHHLKRVIGKELLLTYQELNTLCIKIAAILNSRPLTPLSVDPNDLSALTPAHSLHGETSTDVPAPDFRQLASNRLSHWQHLEKLKQDFWNRWHDEYLGELTQRQKWTHGSHDIKKDSLVLLKDDNIPLLQWRMGRVTEVLPGKDGIVRTAQVKTSTGLVHRNVRRLGTLPID